MTNIETNIELTLQPLASAFRVQDIMVHKERLVSAPDERVARERLMANPHFNVIPIDHKGTLVAYLERDSEDIKRIRLQDVISDATSILDLVSILQERQFCFVVVRHSVSGYIHFSDLNNQIVKLPFFVILEAVEQRLAAEVGSFLTVENLRAALNAKRAEELEKKMSRMREKQADLGWENLLSFNEIVLFANHFGKVNLKPQQIEVISKVRNLICHTGSPLVEEHRHVKRLCDARRILEGMMN